MKILIILPPNQPSGGNWTYAGRLQRGLRPFGIDITLKPLDQVTDADYQAADIIHSYNAYATGRHIAPLARQYGKPLVLTMTGTDVNEHLQHPETRPSMVEVVDYAKRIVFLTEKAKENLAEIYPGAADKSIVINLGVDMPQGVGKKRHDFGLGDDEFIFLLVAGIRPVKRPLNAFAPLARVHQVHPNVRFILAGPVLDDNTYGQVETAFQDSLHARYIGKVPYEEIADLYRCADVVMNTSSSEGLSHALLEAMSLGKPILASHVPGNRDLIEDGVNGFLYHDDDELVAKAELLYTDQDAITRVGEGARQTIQEQFSLERELAAFRDMYNSLVSTDCLSGR
ncbi:MAG TPA: glycosyltransferase [Bacilli bacterium]|nr:glycosyltransferase [Bacilli bacterium]